MARKIHAMHINFPAFRGISNHEVIDCTTWMCCVVSHLNAIGSQPRIISFASVVLIILTVQLHFLMSVVI